VTTAVEAALARYGALTRDAMDPYLPDGEPGGLYTLVRDYPARGGKAIRPALLLATCQAVGGTLRSGLRPAVSLEMLHNAFLIHDDVEDSSLLRRGAPTLHARHGTGLAINAGDALAGLALGPLRQDPVLGPRIGALLVDELVRVVRQTTEGQAIELGWVRDATTGLTPADYLQMVAKKTSWYTTVAPLRMGALAGSRSTARFAALTRFGLHLGTAFQLRDDLLDIEGDAALGKDLHADLREGKRTLMMIHLLITVTGPDRAWLIDVLRRPGTAESAERLCALMVRHGSLEFARTVAAQATATAAAACEEAFAGLPPSEHLDVVRGMITFLADRRR
jgi:geranylgeranyl diphosphate synthase, type II